MLISAPYGGKLGKIIDQWLTGKIIWAGIYIVGQKIILPTKLALAAERESILRLMFPSILCS